MTGMFLTWSMAGFLIVYIIAWNFNRPLNTLKGKIFWFVLFMGGPVVWLIWVIVKVERLKK